MFPVSAHLLQLLTVENIAQALRLLLRVGEDVEPVALQEIVVERLSEQTEVLVEKRLRRDVELDRHLRRARRLCAELDETKAAYLLAEFRRRHEVVLLAHVAHYLLLLYLRSSLQALGHGLLREAVVVYLLDGRTKVETVFHHEQSVFGQKRRERLLFFCELRQFGHDAHLLFRVLRELVRHLERAYSVYLVAEEVDAERQLRRVRVDVDDASAHGELPRLVDIVDLLEAELAHLASKVGKVDDVAHGNVDGALVEAALRHHKFAERLGTGDNVQSLGSCLCRESAQRLGAQYLVGGVALSVLHRTTIRRWEEQHVVGAEYLREVVVEVACLLVVLQNENGGESVEC